MALSEPRVVQLREYTTVAGIELTDEEEIALTKLAGNALTISPSFFQAGHKDLSATSYVGMIDLGTVVIELLPKIPMRQLLFLLTYSLDPSHWKKLEADFAPSPDLVEALIPGYINQMNKALAKGVLRGYRETEDALSGIRGRVRFEEQLRKRLNIAPPIEVRFDEFDQDIAENQVLRAALARLGRMRIRTDLLRRGLRKLDATLIDVSLTHFDPSSLPSIHFTRLNEHYEIPIRLSELILRSTAFDVRHGHIHSSSLLIDMNDVFEDFVVSALQESLGLSQSDFPRQASGKNLYLDTERKRRLKPDISWWRGSTCVFVGDVKYKDIDRRPAPEEDIYQLVTYLTATKLDAGVLVYASRHPTSSRFHVDATGAAIEVHGLGVDEPQERILEQIRYIGQRMRELRSPAMLAAS